MGILRWLTRISVLEWLVIGGAIWLLLQRPVKSPKTTTGKGRDWVIDLCAVITVGSLLAAGFTGQRWLGLLGFATAVLGLAIGVQRSWRRLQRWIRGFWSTEHK